MAQRLHIAGRSAVPHQTAHEREFEPVELSLGRKSGVVLSGSPDGWGDPLITAGIFPGDADMNQPKQT
jgi:hypothetical protein